MVWRSLVVLRGTGRNLFFGFRALDPDPQRQRAVVDAVRIYPFRKRHDPPPTRVISPDRRAWSGDQPRGLAYWERLHEIYQREVMDERRSLLPRDAAPGSGSSPAGRSRPTTGCAR